MIIERKYVTFGQLFNDPKTKKILDEAWIVFDEAEEEKDTWNFMYHEKLIDRAIEWGIPDPDKFFGIIEKGFEELDRTNPYDNGYDYSNINSVVMNAGDETFIELYLCNVSDGEENIVKVVRIDD